MRFSNPARWFSAPQMVLLICATCRSGGPGRPERLGSTPRVPEARSRAAKTIRWSTSPGRMRRPMPSGPGNACPRKPNGNMRRAADSMENATPGATGKIPGIASSSTGGRGTSRGAMTHWTVLPEPRRSVPFLRMAMAFAIWEGMFGTGARTSTARMRLQSVPTRKKCVAIRKVRPRQEAKPSCPEIPPRPRFRVWSGVSPREDRFFAIPATARVTVRRHAAARRRTPAQATPASGARWMRPNPKMPVDKTPFRRLGGGRGAFDKSFAGHPCSRDVLEFPAAGCLVRRSGGFRHTFLLCGRARFYWKNRRRNPGPSPA